jgi:YHS domain-containing protein
MKTIRYGMLALALAGLTSLAVAEDKKTEKPKPYPLEKCVVSNEKLGEMGKPFVFTYEGQEIKLCCKSCQKDFKKNPAKYLKKIKDAEAEKAKK